MKTNQMMEVKIGDYGTLKIYHKDGLTYLDSVLDLVNRSRELKDISFKPLTMRNILSKVELWQFIAELQAVDYNSGVTPPFKMVTDYDKNHNGGVAPSFKIQADYNFLNDYKDNKGRIRYKDLIKMFPNLIKSKRGKNGGTWADLRVALKIASIVDKRIEAEIYTIVVKSNILQIRDNGGEEFKRLNKLIDTLEDRQPHLKPKGNKGAYINIAKLVNEKVNKEFSKGWNGEDKATEEQKMREDILNKLCFAIEVGFIRTYQQLKDTIKKV